MRTRTCVCQASGVRALGERRGQREQSVESKKEEAGECDAQHGLLAIAARGSGALGLPAGLELAQVVRRRLAEVAQQPGEQDE